MTMMMVINGTEKSGWWRWRWRWWRPVARRRADGRPQLFPLAAFLPPPSHIACCVHRNLADSRTWHIWYLVHLVLGTSTHKMMEIYLLCYLLCLCFLQEKFPPSVSKNVILRYIELYSCRAFDARDRQLSEYRSFQPTNTPSVCWNTLDIVHWTMYILPDSYLVHLADPGWYWNTWQNLFFFSLKNVIRM